MDEDRIAGTAKDVTGKLERAVTAAVGVRKHSRHCAPVAEIYPQLAYD